MHIDVRVVHQVWMKKRKRVKINGRFSFYRGFNGCDLCHDAKLRIHKNPVVKPHDLNHYYIQQRTLTFDP